MQTNSVRHAHTNAHDNANLRYNTDRQYYNIIYIVPIRSRVAVGILYRYGIDYSASGLKFSKRNFLAAPINNKYKQSYIYIRGKITGTDDAHH